MTKRLTCVVVIFFLVVVVLINIVVVVVVFFFLAAFCGGVGVLAGSGTANDVEGARFDADLVLDLDASALA